MNNHKRKDNKHAKRNINIFILAIVLIIVPLYFHFTAINFNASPCATAELSQNRNIINATSPIQNLWNLPAILDFNGLSIYDNQVIFANGRCNQLLSMDLLTGGNNWTTGYTAHGTTIDTLHERIYVSAPHAELLAISLLGERLWLNRSQVNNRGSILSHITDDGQVYAYIPFEGLVTVDPVSGVFSPLIHTDLQMSELHLYYFAGNYLWRVWNGSLEAWSITELDKPVWISRYNELNGCCLEQIYLNSEIIILYFHSGVVALSPHTGNLLWAYNQSSIVSNLGISSTSVFALDLDARLLQFDLETGEIINRIDFQLPIAEARDITESGYSIGSSMVASFENYIAVFFGDTDILSIYHLQE